MSQIATYISRKIKELRIARGFTQTALAKQLGVTPNTVSRWESGQYKPKLEDLEKLARTFETPIRALFPPESIPETKAQQALLSATGDLPDEDIHELTRYAEFVRAGRALRRKG